MKINAHGLDLEIKVVSNPPQGDDPLDRWITFSVKLKVPGFTGNFDWETLPTGFFRFAEELQNMRSQIGSKNVATLCGIEPGVEITLTSDHLGHIKGEYEFETYQGGENPTVLKGSFDLDQSYLESWAKEVKTVCDEIN